MRKPFVAEALQKVFAKLLETEAMASHHKSFRYLQKVVDALRTGAVDMKQMLAAMNNTALFSRTDQLKTVSETGAFLSWAEFCDIHKLDGDRFKHLLQPLLDLRTGALEEDGTEVTIRTFGDDDYLLKVEFLLSGNEIDLKVWVACAVFLASHLEYPVPQCMQVDEDAL